MKRRKKVACTTLRHGELSQVSPIPFRIRRTIPLRPVSGSDKRGAKTPAGERRGGSVFFRLRKNGRKMFSRTMTLLLLVFSEGFQAGIEDGFRGDGCATGSIDSFRALLEDHLAARIGDGRVILLFLVLDDFDVRNFSTADFDLHFDGAVV